MKNLYIVDGEIEFLDSIQSSSLVDKVDIKIFTSIKDFNQQIEQTNPDLVFLCLSTPDADEFILYDIFKICSEKHKIPLFITYSDEEIVGQYQNLRYQPKDYLKKPVSAKKIKGILQKYLSNNDESDNNPKKLDRSDTFEKTDLLFDALLEDEKGKKKSAREGKGIFTVHDGEIKENAEEIEAIKSENLKQKKEISSLKNQIKQIENDYKNELDDLKELSQKDRIINLDRIDELENKLSEAEEILLEAEGNHKSENQIIIDKHIKELEKLEKSNKDFLIKEEEYIDKINTLSEQIKNNCENIQELQALEESQRQTISQKEATIKKLTDSIKKFEDKETILISSIEKQKEELKEKQNELKLKDREIKNTQKFLNQFRDLNSKLEDIL
jgi:DNA-binding response OmpR family regulator